MKDCRLKLELSQRQFPHIAAWVQLKVVGISAPYACLSACIMHLVLLQVDAPDGASPYVLPGHQGEVTAVAWCPTDFHQVPLALPAFFPPAYAALLAL
jgi:hypothetical protein